MTRFLSDAYEDLARLDMLHALAAGKPPFPSDTVLGKAELLDSFPLIGSVHRDPFLAARGFRRLFAGRWVAVYRIDGDEACIYRVFHQRAGV